MIRLNVTSETGKLLSVVIGYHGNFRTEGAEIVNETQRAYYCTDQKPTALKLETEFTEFKSALESRGVQVYVPEPVEGVYDQLTPRDIGFVIGDTFVVASMSKKSRKREIGGIDYLMKSFTREVTRVPSDIVLEGGDVIVEGNTVYVGLSQRTDYRGIKFLESAFPQREILPVPLRTLADDEDVLHLDCAFVPVGRGYALIYPPGFAIMPEEISGRYEFIEVTKQEQGKLATNVLNIPPDTLLSRKGAGRLNSILKEKGIEVVELQFDEAPKTGGSFRCCTLPLCRE